MALGLFLPRKVGVGDVSVDATGYVHVTQGNEDNFFVFEVNKVTYSERKVAQLIDQVG